MPIGKPINRKHISTHTHSYHSFIFFKEKKPQRICVAKKDSYWYENEIKSWKS